MLTGTWLERGKLPAGLFFLLLLLLLVPPPALMVLPPEILRFRRLLGACRAGSADERETKTMSFMISNNLASANNRNTLEYHKDPKIIQCPY